MFSFHQSPRASTLRAMFAGCLLFTTTSLVAQQTCGVDPVTPLLAGPSDPVSKFSTRVTDANGMTLELCLDQGGGLPNPAQGFYCFFDPVVPSNPYSVQINRGVEAFYYLADNLFSTSGPNAINGRASMAVESTFTTGTVLDGAQTQFQRLRIQMDVARAGFYVVEYPWGSREYRVDVPGKRAIRDTVDITFPSGQSSAGLVTPFLRWDPAIAPFAPAGFLGDGATPHKVVGSPCNKNYVKVTAFNLDRTPLAINGASNTVTSDQFTIVGKLAPTGVTPLSVGNAYYSRNSTGSTVNIMAKSSPGANVQVSDLLATPAAMTSDTQGVNFFLSSSVAVVPATVTLRAFNTGAITGVPTLQSDLVVPVVDLVTIRRAEAICAGQPKLCTITVEVESSDTTGSPLMTLDHNGQTFPPNGVITLANTQLVPGYIAVSSNKGGRATKPLVIINQ